MQLCRSQLELALKENGFNFSLRVSQTCCFLSCSSHCSLSVFVACFDRVLRIVRCLSLLLVLIMFSALFVVCLLKTLSLLFVLIKKNSSRCSLSVFVACFDHVLRVVRCLSLLLVLIMFPALFVVCLCRLF